MPASTKYEPRSRSAETIEYSLAEALGTGAHTIVVPGAVGRRDIEHLGAKLAVLEAERGLVASSTRILAIVADTAAGALALAGLKATPRLAGLACDPARLASALGCDVSAPAVVQASAMTVLAAAACGVPAILASDRTDQAALDDAARNGFAALLVRR